MSEKRKAAIFAGLALLALLAGCAAGAVLPDFGTAAVGAGFISYVACGRKAMLLAHADDKVFVPHRYWNPRPETGSPVASGFVAGTIGSYLLGRSVRPGHEWRAGRSLTPDLLHFRQRPSPERSN
ncbi:MAG TPA: hypothetical protein VN032_09035 [Thermoanaerobaculia bacterium]|nr:hypothetical protein [Thermoanaerobaculia bacterium]